MSFSYPVLLAFKKDELLLRIIRNNIRNNTQILKSIFVRYDGKIPLAIPGDLWYAMLVK